MAIIKPLWLLPGHSISILFLVAALVDPYYTCKAFVHPCHQRTSPSIASLGKPTLDLPRATLPRLHNTVTRRTPSKLIERTSSTTTRLSMMSLLPQNDWILAWQASSQQQHPLLPFLENDIISPITNGWKVYETLLKLHPLTTKSTTAAFLAFLGDAIAQKASSKDCQASSYDLARGLTFLLFGGLYTGAFQHVWFTYLSNHVAEWGEAWHVWGPQRAALTEVFHSQDWWTYFDVTSSVQLEQPPPSAAVLAAAKVAVNQFLILPVVYMPLFFLVTGNFHASRAVQRAQALYVHLLRRNYLYWLPVQFVQFFVLPVEWQIPFVSAASLVWTIILSSIGSAVPAAAAATSQVAVLALPPRPVVSTKVPSLVPSLQDQVVVMTHTSEDVWETNDVTKQVVSVDDSNPLGATLLLPPSMVVAQAETVDDRTAYAASLGSTTMDSLANMGGVVVGAETDMGVVTAAAAAAAVGTSAFWLINALQVAKSGRCANKKRHAARDDKVIDVSIIVG